MSFVDRLFSSSLENYSKIKFATLKIFFYLNSFFICISIMKRRFNPFDWCFLFLLHLPSLYVWTPFVSLFFFSFLFEYIFIIHRLIVSSEISWSISKRAGCCIKLIREMNLRDNGSQQIGLIFSFAHPSIPIIQQTIIIECKEEEECNFKDCDSRIFFLYK